MTYLKADWLHSGTHLCIGQQEVDRNRSAFGSVQCQLCNLMWGSFPLVFFYCLLSLCLISFSFISLFHWTWWISLKYIHNLFLSCKGETRHLWRIWVIKHLEVLSELYLNRAYYHVMMKTTVMRHITSWPKPKQSLVSPQLLSAVFSQTTMSIFEKELLLSPGKAGKSPFWSKKTTKKNSTKQPRPWI